MIWHQVHHGSHPSMSSSASPGYGQSTYRTRLPSSAPVHARTILKRLRRRWDRTRSPPQSNTDEERNAYSISIHTAAIYNYRGNMYKIKRERNLVHACGIYIHPTQVRVYERARSLEYEAHRLVKVIRRNTLTLTKMVCSKAPSPSPCTKRRRRIKRIGMANSRIEGETKEADYPHGGRYGGARISGWEESQIEGVAWVWYRREAAGRGEIEGKG